MVPPQSLLPDGQSVVQQVGRLLVFVLIPGRTQRTKQTHWVRIAEKNDSLSGVTRSNVDLFFSWTVPTVCATLEEQCVEPQCKRGPPLCFHTSEQWRFVEVCVCVCERVVCSSSVHGSLVCSRFSSEEINASPRLFLRRNSPPVAALLTMTAM